MCSHCVQRGGRIRCVTSPQSPNHFFVAEARQRNGELSSGYRRPFGPLEAKHHVIGLTDHSHKFDLDWPCFVFMISFAATWCQFRAKNFQKSEIDWNTFEWLTKYVTWRHDIMLIWVQKLHTHSRVLLHRCRHDCIDIYLHTASKCTQFTNTQTRSILPLLLTSSIHSHLLIQIGTH